MGFYMYLLALLTFELQKLSWGLKIMSLVFSAGITEYTNMAQGQYEGMTHWILPKPTPHH